MPIHHLSSRTKQIPTSYIREILSYATQPGVISFAGGIPEESLFPTDEIKFSMNQAMLINPIRALQYGITEGNPELRMRIAEDYHKKGLNITEENILITNGSQQGLDLIAKLFLDKGKKVLLEGPSYLGAIQCFSQYECGFEEVILEIDGPNLDQLHDILWEQHARIPFMYLIPDFQNPTGVQYSLEKRLQTGKLLQQHHSWILEDCPYKELNYDNEHLPSMLELFPENTIQLGSFSKILTPGLRMGWIVAPTKLIQMLKLIKQASDLHSNGLVQEIILDLKQRQVIENHLPVILNAYRKRRDTMVSELKPYSDILKINYPKGGMFCWGELSEGTAEELNKDCITNKLVFVPGHHFYSGAKNVRSLRLNFSKNDSETIRHGIQILGNILTKKSLQNTR